MDYYAMLAGKQLGDAIAVAIKRKLESGAVKSKAEIARHFHVKLPSIFDQLARQAPAFMPGKDSASAGGRLDVGLGVRFWFPAVKQLSKLCHPGIINLFPVFCRQANRANNQQFVRLLRWSSARLFCCVHCAILRHTNELATT